MGIVDPAAAPLPGASSEHSRDFRDYGRLKPGPGQLKTHVIASQRTRLQRAIVEIAAEEGLPAVTVRRLTGRAGVSTASFYARFSGIDDCLLTAYGEIMSSATRLVIDARSPDLGAADQLERALRALLSRLSADRNVSRFALIEIYGGGPAAMTAIGREEERLRTALRGCVDRRGKRIPKMKIAALLAAVLHCVRTELIDASTDEKATIIDALVEWATDVIEERDDFPLPDSARSWRSTSDPKWTPGAPRELDEKNLIEATILRLATPDGFRGLDSSKVSSASGLPAACFGRHFATLADGYLAAIRRTSASFFAELTARKDPSSPVRTSIRDGLRDASRRAASDPAAARLTFRQIIEPGVAGLTCREALISELALACSDGSSVTNSSVRVRAKARIAALWETLGQMDSLRSQRPARLS